MGSGELQSEPPTDFGRSEERAAMERAVREVGGRLGDECGMRIDGLAQQRDARRVSYHPSRGDSDCPGALAGAVPMGAFHPQLAQGPSMAWGHS